MDGEELVYKIQFKRAASSSFDPTAEGEVSLAYGEPFIYQDSQGHLHLLIGPNNGNETTIAEVNSNYSLYVPYSEHADNATHATLADNATRATVAENGWKIEYENSENTLTLTKGQ